MRSLKAQCADPDINSAVTRHCYDLNHPFDDIQPCLLDPCEKGGARMNRLEELYTLKFAAEGRRTGFNVMNDMEAVCYNKFISFMISCDDSF